MSRKQVSGQKPSYKQATRISSRHLRDLDRETGEVLCQSRGTRPAGRLHRVTLAAASARFDHISVLMIGFTLIGGGYGIITLSAGTLALYVGLALAGIGLGQLALRS